MRQPLASVVLAACLSAAFAGPALAQSAPSPAPPSESPPAEPVSGPVETPDALTSTTPPTSQAMLGVNMPAEHRHDPTPVTAKPEPWLDGHALGAEALFRGGSRIGSSSLNADTQEKAGLGFDLAAWLRLLPEFSFGFALKRMSLGNLSYTSGQSTLNASYATTALELGARAYPFRWTGADLFLGLRAGLAWQHVDAKGLRPSVNLEPAHTYSCSDTSGPDFALGAEVGAELRLTRAFWLVGSVGADGYRLTSDAVGNCVSGIGSVTGLSVAAGLLYAFDLGREAKVATSQRRMIF